VGIRARVYGDFAEDTNLLSLSVLKHLMNQPVTFLYTVYGTLASTHLEALKENTGRMIMQNLHYNPHMVTLPIISKNLLCGYIFKVC
jgi:hypothetical protein